VAAMALSKSFNAALAAAAAVCLIAAFVLLAGPGRVELEAKGKAPRSSLTHREAHAEMLAAQAQEHLAQKDARIYNSLRKAAESKIQNAESLDKKFFAAREHQVALDQRLEQLTQRFEAQKEALAYMFPKTEAREMEAKKMPGYVQQLQGALPQLQKDLKGVQGQLEKIKAEAKPSKREARVSNEIMDKTSNAARLFGQRDQKAVEAAQVARMKTEELNNAALMAQRTSQQLRMLAKREMDPKKAQLLVQEANEADAKVAMLSKQSAEQMQTAQLYDAEADEAGSYSTMFGADAQTAQQRLSTAEKKLQYLAAQYQQGLKIEAQGEQREQFLKSQLNAAKAALGMAGLEATEDAKSLKIGEEATEQTIKKIQQTRTEAEENTASAIKDVFAVKKDHNNYNADTVQAMSVVQQVRDHEAAAEHFDDAAGAAKEEGDFAREE